MRHHKLLAGAVYERFQRDSVESWPGVGVAPEPKKNEHMLK